jgi:hypothetical protein
MSPADLDRKLEAIRKEQERIDGRQRRSADDAFLIADHIRLGEMAREANLPFLTLAFRAKALRSENPKRAWKLICDAESDLRRRKDGLSQYSLKNRQFAESFLLTVRARILDTMEKHDDAVEQCALALFRAQSLLEAGANQSPSTHLSLKTLVDLANSRVGMASEKWKPEELKWLILDPMGAALLCFEDFACSCQSFDRPDLLKAISNFNEGVLGASPWLQLTLADAQRQDTSGTPNYDSVIKEALSRHDDGVLPSLREMLESIEEGQGEHIPRRDRPALYATIQKKRREFMMSKPDPYFHLIYELRTNLDAIAWKRIESKMAWNDDIERIPNTAKREGTKKQLPDGSNSDKKAHSFESCSLMHVPRIDKAAVPLDSAAPTTIEEDKELVVLRSWSSYTPLISRRGSHPLGLRRHSRGGGYLVRWRGLGIAIDPGIGFVHNLYEAERSINDIDIILVSHNHPDHTIDVPAVLNLFHVAGKGKGKHTWILSNKVNQRFGQLIGDQHGEGKSAAVWDIFEVPGVAAIHALPAHHPDLGNDVANQSLGFLLDLHETDEKKSRRLLFTCDTHWCSNMSQAYQSAVEGKRVDVLVPHLSDVFVDLLVPGRDGQELFRYNHLGLRGTYDAIRTIKPKVAAVGEWGQELEGYRKPIADAMQKALARDPEMKGIRKPLTGRVNALGRISGMLGAWKRLEIRQHWFPREDGSHGRRGSSWFGALLTAA